MKKKRREGRPTGLAADRLPRTDEAHDAVSADGPRGRQAHERVGAVLALAGAGRTDPGGVRAGSAARFHLLDDTAYVTENEHVTGGLTAANVWWAATGISAQAANWHPLTWLSHMLDVELFGLNAGRHHAVSVVLHAGERACSSSCCSSR